MDAGQLVELATQLSDAANAEELRVQSIQDSADRLTPLFSLPPTRVCQLVNRTGLLRTLYDLLGRLTAEADVGGSPPRAAASAAARLLTWLLQVRAFHCCSWQLAWLQFRAYPALLRLAGFVWSDAAQYRTFVCYG